MLHNENKLNINLIGKLENNRRSSWCEVDCRIIENFEYSKDGDS